MNIGVSSDVNEAPFSLSFIKWVPSLESVIELMPKVCGYYWDRFVMFTNFYLDSHNKT